MAIPRLRGLPAAPLGMTIECEPARRYSDRSTEFGSTLVARRAGIELEHGNQHEHPTYHAEHASVRRRLLEQQRLHPPRGKEGERRPDDDPQHREPDALTHHEPNDVL